jgi:hypothetical protein
MARAKTAAVNQYALSRVILENRRIGMRLHYACIALLAAGATFADTLTLRNGRVVNGTYLGGTSRQVRMEVGDRIENFDIGEIANITFQSGAAPANNPSSATTPTRRATDSSGNVFRPDTTTAASPAAAQTSKEIPAGTQLVIRMIDSVDSEVNRVGQTFTANLDEPITINGQSAVPRGADVIVKLVNDEQSGKLTGRTELTLDVVSITVDGRVVDVNTQEITQASDSRTTSTAQRAGGGAALGAIIGAIAGGGRGAAVGAAAGAGAGTAVQVMTKGQRVRIPSETRLTFTLQNPVRI